MNESHAQQVDHQQESELCRGRILFVCWDKAEMEAACTIKETATPLSPPAYKFEITTADPTDVAEPAASGARELERMQDTRVVAVVLFCSHNAIEKASLANWVKACTTLLAARRDFRLFVQLRGLKWQDLVNLSGQSQVIDQLMDSVHLPQRLDEETPDCITQELASYLQGLSQLRRHERLVACKMLLLDVARRVRTAIAVGLAALIAVFVLFSAKVPGEWFPWVVFLIGSCLYGSLVAVLSAGLPLRSGELTRTLLLIGPIAVLQTWHIREILAVWPFLVSGVGLAFITDMAVRAGTAEKRKQLPLDQALALAMRQKTRPVGQRFLSLLKFGPLLPPPNQVFISYARTSKWGNASATRLRHELEKAGVNCFQDPQIEPGSSWRHELGREIGSSTIFVQFQDEQTAVRPWPTTELVLAAYSQNVMGLPRIIVLLKPGFHQDTPCGEMPPLVRSTLFPKREVDPTMLQVIEHGPESDAEIVQSLFARSSRTGIISPLLVRLFGPVVTKVFILPMGLGFAEMVGTSVLIGVLLIWGMAGFQAWLVQQNLFQATALLLAYWIGFVVMLGLDARLKLPSRVPNLPALLQLPRALILGIVLWWFLLPRTDFLIYVNIIIAVGIGFLVGSHSVSIWQRMWDFLFGSFPILAPGSRRSP